MKETRKTYTVKKIMYVFTNFKLIAKDNLEDQVRDIFF